MQTATCWLHLAEIMEKGRVEGKRGGNCEERDAGGTVENRSGEGDEEASG